MLTAPLRQARPAKWAECVTRCPLSQDFTHGRQLFSACLELVTEFSPKLRQVMLNEMLLLEVRAHEAGAGPGATRERPPADLVSRVRGYLEMRIHGEHRAPRRTKRSCRSEE